MRLRACWMKRLVLLVGLILAVCTACNRAGAPDEMRYENADRSISDIVLHGTVNRGFEPEDRFVADIYRPAFQSAREKLRSVADGSIRTYTMYAFSRDLNQGNYILYAQWLQHDTGARRIVLRDGRGLIGEFVARTHTPPELSFLTGAAATIATRPPYDGGPDPALPIVRVTRPLERNTLELCVVEVGASADRESWIPVAIGDLPAERLPDVFKERESGNVDAAAKGEP